MKCKWCGKEFEPKNKIHKYCCYHCRTEEFNTIITAKRNFRRIAKENEIELNLENLNKITNAKMIMFKKNYLQCPCDASDKERYCGSKKCIEEVKTKGICHCGLFKEKKSE